MRELTQGRRRQYLLRWDVPIVDHSRRIVGWTAENPKNRGAVIHHAQAEKLLGRPITCAYVQLKDQPSAERAGAPPGWKEPWRCLAIIAVGATDGGGLDAPVIDVSP